MRLNTIQRRKARGGLEAAFGKEELVNRMYQIIEEVPWCRVYTIDRPP